MSSPEHNLSRMEALIEKLATLEHEQWTKWSQTLSNSEKSISVGRRERWRSLWVPYSELSEQNKDSDRAWAQRVLEIISKDVQEFGPL